MQADKNERMLYNFKEMQQLLGIGKTLAYKLVQERDFPKLMINGRYYFQRAKLEKWLERYNGKNFNTH